MSYKHSFSSGTNTQILYGHISSAKNGNRGNTKAEREKTSIPSSGKYCSICHEMVGNGDPDREDIDNERRHRSCVRRLAFLQGKNTELCRMANL